MGPHAGQTDADGCDGGLEVPDSARRPAPAAGAATPDVGADGAPAPAAAEGPHPAAADWRHGVVQGPAALPVAAAPGKPVHRQTGERAVPALPVPAGGDRLPDAPSGRTPGRRDGAGQDDPNDSGPPPHVAGRDRSPHIARLSDATGLQLVAGATSLG